ncbi:MAG: Zn-dependent alcohol dehydrogenase, partial [Thermoanaerobaculia bacterium]|nr:Zn-dependent alcohol dehydrogenase [Thermoanaerobaculia bacterium]
GSIMPARKRMPFAIRLSGPALLKTAASGICHSDLHVIEGGLPVPPPCVLGHEPAGVVEAVGEGVSDFAPGDHVIGCLTSWCGVCRFCTEGRPYLCRVQFVGRPEGAKPRLTGRGGEPITQLANLASFAERMLCPERSLVKIRDDMPLDRASLIGCGVTTGLGAAFNTVDIPTGASVVVIGCGGVGLSALQGARIVGAGRIIAVDAQPWKFGLAQKLGATDCVDATDGDPVAAVHALTGGGADFVFECIGLTPTVQQALAMTARGGTAVLVGVVPMTEQVPIFASDLTLQEKKLVGSYMGSNRFRFDMPKYLDFYADGRLHLDEMISARIALDQVNEAFEAMRKGEAARQVIVFD